MPGIEVKPQTTPVQVIDHDQALHEGLSAPLQQAIPNSTPNTKPAMQTPAINPETEANLSEVFDLNQKKESEKTEVKKKGLMDFLLAPYRAINNRFNQWYILRFKGRGEDPSKEFNEKKVERAADMGMVPSQKPQT